jgi:hypothetical protein
MQKLFVLCACLILLGSCNKTYYQLFTTQSKEVQKDTRNQYLFQDNNLSINYNLLSRGGDLYFDVYNKTDRPVYIDLNKCHYIYKGQSFAYENKQNIDLTKGIIQIPAKTFSAFKYAGQITAGVTDDKVIYAAKGSPDVVTFDEKTSPIWFRNYLTYSFSENMDNSVIIDNKFWVESIAFMTSKVFFQQHPGPEKFYISFTKYPTSSTYQCF